MTQGSTGSKGKIIMIIVAILFLLMAAGAGFFFWKWLQLKNNPAKANEDASQTVITEVGKIYQLPTDEEPTIAKIQDKAKLSKQQFFEPAQNGDYILIYSKKKLALIYRQEAKKLINVGPITSDTQPVTDQ